MESSMKQYAKITIVILIIFCSIYLNLHQKNDVPKNEFIVMNVTAEQIITKLFYSGIIQPLKKSLITSATDGIIENIQFHYGDHVNSGQVLFIIASEKFQTDFKTAVMQYIKSKTEFATHQNQLSKSTFLYNHQLISEDEFKSKKNIFYNSRLEMMQSKLLLDTILSRLDLHNYNIYNLKIEDIDKITQVLQSQNGSQHLKIIAPVSGLVLLSPNSDSNDGELKKITTGRQLKQGEVLAIIADENGLVIHINVNEFNINQLKLGQTVKITGTAFPDIILNGKITELNPQGETGQNGIPTFPVDVTVSNLTPKEQALIHMGMSVKVSIEIIQGEKITVPIKAITQIEGQAYVKIKDKKSGIIHTVPVKVGETTLDSVVVESNLIAGDQIVFS
jgi:HlyD family secretion protein